MINRRTFPHLPTRVLTGSAVQVNSEILTPMLNCMFSEYIFFPMAKCVIFANGEVIYLKHIQVEHILVLCGLTGSRRHNQDMCVTVQVDNFIKVERQIHHAEPDGLIMNQTGRQMKSSLRQVYLSQVLLGKNVCHVIYRQQYTPGFSTLS